MVKGHNQTKPMKNKDASREKQWIYLRNSEGWLRKTVFLFEDL